MAEFESEAGATPDVVRVTYPSAPVYIPQSPTSAASPRGAKMSSGAAMATGRRRHRLGDNIIEAFKSPQSDRVSILAMTVSF